MPSSHQATSRPYWSSGRGFASKDPERQGEVLGYVARTPIETTALARPAAPKAAPPQRSWTRLQPDVDASGFEGSSSGRWR
ncbi:hypothetical protein [Ramlibacter alkalitolerans]|uniref:Uncharacterized protein n=1 Tax=Ramlibacter alkalitolerans TaxID=2039631 RepID=A0ABS1JSK6_9BURK|nr:hypothetical protein [Ramlibacter alkalitolerans]MBL0427222.1 hypothetical protein [Ramlibacter alkalitolerans]